jgi:hypothetical protein
MLHQNGFNRLDFDRVRRVAAQAGFDVRACACKKKSCGPGADWLVQDKRYYVLTLLQHIEALFQAGADSLPPDVLDWYKEAKAAALEYARMEEALYPALKKG